MRTGVWATVALLLALVSCTGGGEQHVATIVDVPLRTQLTSLRLYRCGTTGCAARYEVAVTNEGKLDVSVEECRLSAFAASDNPIYTARIVIDPPSGLDVLPTATRVGSGMLLWPGVTRQLNENVSRRTVNCQAWDWLGSPPI